MAICVKMKARIKPATAVRTTEPSDNTNRKNPIYPVNRVSKKNRNLVEMNHTASVSRQSVDIKLDPLHNRLHRPIFRQRCIDTCCYEGVVIICKFLYSIRSDFIQVRIKHTQGARAALELLHKKPLRFSAFGIASVPPRYYIVNQFGF